MMDAKTAKQLEVVENNLVKKFRKAEQDENMQRLKKLKEFSTVSPLVKTHTPTKLVNVVEPPLTVAAAKKLENIKNKLHHQFTDVYTREMEEQREREKKYESITKAIKEKRDKDSLEDKTKELLKKQKYNQIVERFRPRLSSTPDRKQLHYNTDDEVDVKDTLQNQSIKELVDSNVVNLGLVGAKYLPRANDAQFGIYYDLSSEHLKIGSEPINFDYDDIIMSGKRFKGTEGLWKLLTYKGLVKLDEFTKNDWENYKAILLTSNSLYQKNDPSSRRPKSSGGQKWKLMIKPIWDETNKPTIPPPEPSQIEGSGLKKYDNKTPIEYRYIKDFNELISRLNFIHAEEAAGNNNFYNEKLSVVKFIYDRMQELIERPNGLKYLIRCLSALPEHTIQGSGLLNTLINKLPFELHAPRDWKFNTYNYCGPGTKLSQRLQRGDKGINPLDEACKKHDIWYRDHRRAEDRWGADKELQNAAWNRVTSSDADLNERAVALGTSGAMWLKRKLGLGLGTSVTTNS